MIPDLTKIFKKLSNPFNKLTDEEEDALLQVELSVKKDIKNLSLEARELFDDQRYQKLKKDFKDIYEANLRLIINYNCVEPDKYIMKMRELQVRLRTLKSIFDTPEGFIKRAEEIDADNIEHKERQD